MAEMADVGAARLGREGKTERIGDAHRGGAVGVEELGVDDVEPAPARGGKDRARHLSGVEARAVARDQGEARAQDREAVPLLGRSEEHTSELQSLMRIPEAVFCLDKKNTNLHRINE